MTLSTALPDPPRAMSHRRLGVPGLSVHYAASVLGAGILILPGLALEVAGPGSILAWMFLIGFSYAFAWVLAMLSVRYPTRKGLPFFLRQAFGPGWERGAGLLLALVIAGGIIPVYAIAAARRMVALGVVPATWSPTLIAVLIVAATLSVGLAGLRLGARVQIGLVIAVGAVLLLAVCLALPHADTANLSAPMAAGWHGIGMAIALCFFGVIGWDNAASLAEEVRDPARTMPGAAMLAVTAVGLLYLAFAITLVLTVPTAGSDAVLSPVGAMFARAAGDHGDRLGSLISLTLILLATNAWTLSGSRLIAGLGEQRILPASVSYLRVTDGTPTLAYAVLGIVAFVVLLLVQVLDWGETEVMAAVSSTFIVLYVAVILAALRLLPRPRDRLLALATLVTLCAMATIYAATTAAAAAVLILLVSTQKLTSPNAMPGANDVLR